MTVVQRIYVKVALSAFHTDPNRDEGRHRHTWRVRACFPAKPFRDTRDLTDDLKERIAHLQGSDLPRAIWATEDLALVVLNLLGDRCFGVELTREDGSDGDVWRI